MANVADYIVIGWCLAVCIGFLPIGLQKIRGPNFGPLIFRDSSGNLSSALWDHCFFVNRSVSAA